MLELSNNYCAYHDVFDCWLCPKAVVAGTITGSSREAARELTPLERHKADLEAIIKACSQAPLMNAAARVRHLAESLLVRLPEESHCPNHPADQICPECTS